MPRVPARSGRPWSRRLLLLGLLALLVPGTPALLLHNYAASLVADRQRETLVASGGTVNQLPQAGARYQAAPPSPSGAFPPYPLNHAFDAYPLGVGTPPTNSGFETAEYQVGTPPANYDFSTAPYDYGAVPTNNDFATGTFSGWTTAGTATIASDATHGSYAQLSGSGSTATTAAWTVDAGTQVFAFEAWWLNSSSAFYVDVLLSPYTTPAQSSYVYCSCAGWQTWQLDASAYLGQTIKLRFRRHIGTVGFDAVRTSIVAQSWALSGRYAYDAPGGNGRLVFSGSAEYATTAAFTVDSAAQHAAVTLTSLETLLAGAEVSVLSGSGFATSTKLLSVYEIPATPTVYRFLLAPWAGQTIKLKVKHLTRDLALDDVGIQWVDAPGWTASNPGVPWRYPQGDRHAGEDTGAGPDPSTVFLLSDETLTSAAFTVPSTAQQLSVRHKLSATGVNSHVKVDLLTGATFSTVVQLTGGVGIWTTAEWTAFRAPLGAYAGQTIKIRITGDWGGVLVDDVGFMEQVAPGWIPLKLGTNGAIDAREDAVNGTFLTAFASSGTFEVQSSLVDTGIVDRGSASDVRSYALGYAFGAASGSSISVKWTPVDPVTGTPGTTITVYTAAKPTGGTTDYQNARFRMLDVSGTHGYFTVRGTGGARVYAIADNVARQQLGEPFSQQVSLDGGAMGVDTSTGSFGVQEMDLALDGALPLVLSRYYAGHSDRLGPMGYRWRHAFDTQLYVVGGTGPDAGDVAVLFATGSEEYFDHDSVAGSYAPVDVRVHSTLSKNVDGSYVYTTRAGMVFTFLATGDLAKVIDPNGNELVLAYDAGTGLLASVTAPGGRELTFTYTSGRLTEVDGSDGTTVTYGYDSRGNLATVTRPGESGPVSRSYTYTRHRLSRILDEEGRRIARTSLDAFNRVIRLYDASDNSLSIAYQTPGDGATQVTDRRNQGVTTYHFDRFARTTHVVAPTGEVTQFVYDADGNLEKWIDGTGGQYQFAYTNGDLIGITDPLNRQTNITVDPGEHLPTLVVDAQGTRTEYTYDANGNRTRVVVDATDPANPTARPYLNLTTDYEYDAAGNLTAVIQDPDDGPVAGTHLNLVTVYGYDAHGHVTSMTVDPDDPGRAGTELNLTWTYAYTAAGRLDHEIDPDGRMTAYVYGFFGDLVQIIQDPDDPANPLTGPYLELTQQYVYDDAGNLILARDPVAYAADPLGTNGVQTEWLYDDRALVTDRYDEADVRTAYGYDADGRMTQAVVDPPDPAAPTGNELNLTTVYVYDDTGRLVRTVVDPDDGTGDPELNLVTAYTYDAAGRLETTTVDPEDAGTAADELDLTTTYQYDANGQLIGKALPDGAVWTYAYDELGQLISLTDPLSHVTEYHYDRAGRQTETVVDPGAGHLNLTTTTVYDAAGRVTAATDASGVMTAYAYDRAGRLVQTTLDPGSSPHLNIETSSTYSPGGLLLETTDPTGLVTSYAYDHAGRTTSVTAPGGRITTYGYDANGQVTETVSPAGVVTMTAYDDLGRVTQMVVDPEDAGTPADELDLTTSFAYDAAGRQTAMTNPRGYTTSTAYDAAGRRISLTDAATPAGSIEFAYDAASRLVALTDANNHDTTYAYDEMGRPTAVIDPLTRTEERDYNGLGQLTQRVDPNGNDLRYGYDAAGRLTAITDPSNDPYVSYGYDAVGRPISATNVTGALGYDYDAAGRLTQVTSPQGTVGYGYDDAGRRTEMTLPPTTPSGPARPIAYAYDPVTGDLASMTDWDNRTTTFGFTYDGLLYSVARPNGVDSLYNYDTADRLIAISHNDAGSTALAEYGYTLDANGNRTQVDVTGSAVANGTETYTFDELDRLTNVTYPGGGSASYAYDAAGNRTRVTSGGTWTDYVYDAAGQLQELRDQTNALLVDLDYDANGNRIAADSHAYTYDWANRLTEATVGSATVDLDYLADGTRLNQTVGTTTTPYEYDRAGGLPMLVDDGSDAYLHGPGLLGEVDDATDADAYGLADALGSVRARTDGAGSVTGTADWDVYGNLRNATGSGGAFGWAGEQADPATGLVYLRARYYSPGSGQFLTADTVQPNAPGTQGYTRYAYAAGNPVTVTDPSGHSLRELGDALARAWAYMLWVLDRALHGEFRFQREHGDLNDDAGSLSFEHFLDVLKARQDKTRDKAKYWTARELANAARGWPVLPGRGYTMKTLTRGFDPGGGQGGMGLGPSEADSLIRALMEFGVEIAWDIFSLFGGGGGGGGGVSPDPAGDCRKAAHQGWLFPPARRMHVEERHAPWAIPNQIPENGIFNDVFWENQMELVGRALTSPLSRVFLQRNGNCRFEHDMPFRIGEDGQGRPTWTFAVILRPRDHIVISFFPCYQRPNRAPNCLKDS